MGPAPTSLPVLVLAVLLLHALGDDFLPLPALEFDSYEITIPMKLSFWRGKQGVSGSVAYLLQLKGKRHVLHLRPKSLLLPPHLRVFSFSDQGQLLEDFPYIPEDCNLVGSVEGARDSEATLSTCMGGLRGILSIDAKHYQIEPLEASSSFEHVVYLLKKGLRNQTCGLTGELTERQMGQREDRARLRDFTGSYKHQKYMELVMVFDHDRYLYVKSNLSQVVNAAILLSRIMDSYFREIHMRIHLKALEIWTDKDKINIDVPRLNQVLDQFALYRRNILNARIPTDWSHLYVKRNFPKALRWAFVGKMCSEMYGASTSVFPNLNILAPATWWTHELGHGLGMKHDEKDCRCKGQHTCLMGTGRTRWSNCSYVDYLQLVYSGASCLNNIPERGYMIERCGNKIMEEDEECDCGSREDCREDQCCGTNCRLKRGSNCSIGLCCHKCKFLLSGSVCRQEENECDLAEYCNGTSGFCPDDTYKQDGTPCKYRARCFKKGCRSRFMQCQSIFGPDAREGPHRCYDAVNLIGDQYGNCEMLGLGDYKKCNKANSICGRLQCINIKNMPNLPDHTTIISTHLQEENVMCWGTGYHLAMKPLGIPDLGVINDGTSCGQNRVCFNRTCVNSSVLQSDCLPEKCNGRGVCNSKKHCHCMYGWAPPFCEEVGYGGSLDSGPPGLRSREIPPAVQVMSLVLLRIILFVISAILVLFRHIIVKCLG